jgi:hypothetical protein
VSARKAINATAKPQERATSTRTEEGEDNARWSLWVDSGGGEGWWWAVLRVSMLVDCRCRARSRGGGKRQGVGGLNR